MVGLGLVLIEKNKIFYIEVFSIIYVNINVVVPPSLVSPIVAFDRYCNLSSHL